MTTTGTWPAARRIGLALLLLIAFGFCAGLVKSQWTLRGLWRSLQARADFQAGRAELWSGRVDIQNVRLLHQDSTASAWLTAESMHLQLDRRALLEGKYVIENGRARNVRLIDHGCPKPALCLGENPRGWLQNPEAVSTEITQAAQRTISRWESASRQRDTLVKQVQNVSLRLDEIPDRTGNPLRPSPTDNERSSSVGLLRELLLKADSQSDDLSRQVLADEASLLAARDADLLALNRSSNAFLLDESKVSTLLAGQSTRQQIQEILAWVQTLQAARSTAQDSEQIPGMIIRSLRFETEHQIAGQSIVLDGWIQNCNLGSPDSSAPCVVELKSQQGVSVEARAELGRRGGVRRDRVQIHIDDLPLASHTLGDEDLVTFDLEPARLDVVVDIEQMGEQIDGFIRTRLRNVTLTSRSDKMALASKEAKDELSRVLSATRDIETEFRIRGTWDKVRIDPRSSLSPRLIAVMQQAWESMRLERLRENQARIEQAYHQSLEICGQIASQELDRRAWALDQCASRIADLGWRNTRLR